MPENNSIIATAVPAYSDNYIWLLHSHEKKEVVIVDPGDARVVISALSRLSLIPCAILITHHHYDHIDGINELLRHFQIPVYGPENGTIPGLSQPMRDGDHFTLSNGLTFSIIATPGHTQDHICYFSEQILLSGDTLFAGGCGRLLGGTATQLYDSLLKLRNLPDHLLFYCAHEYTLSNLRFALEVEPDNQALTRRYSAVKKQRENKLCTLPSTLAIEKETNPFLRCDEPTVIAAAENFSGRPMKNGADVFAVVRYWKDTY